MKKRFLLPLFACAAALLTACGGHTHSAEGGWVSDLENHWHICSCGEQVDAATHTLENDVCTACGSEVVTYEDGSSHLATYNEYGDCTSFIFYAADGTVDYEDRAEYTYDADGNMLSQKTYNNDVLSSEYEYALNASGEVYLAKDTYYHDDGTMSFSEYDENGNILQSVSYLADGTVDYAYEYEYSADGSWMSEKTYYGDWLASEREYSVDADGWQTAIKDITYNEDGSWVGTEYDLYENAVIEIHSDTDGNVVLDRRYEHTYDADGNRTLTKTYDNGRLVEEMEFLFGSDAEGSWSRSGKTTTYHEDGSKTVSDSDPEGTWSSEITYDANGKVTEELRYEYDFDENGESTGSRGYRNGKLFQEMRGIVGPDGEATGILNISYEEDGSKTVTEYDAYFDLVKETVYDADGNVISES